MKKQDQSISVEIESSNPAAAKIATCSTDVVGSLSVITGWLSSYGLNITDADIQTVGGRAENKFAVNAPEDFNWDAFEKDLLKIISRIEQGDVRGAQTEVNTRIIHWLRQSSMPTDQYLNPLHVEIDQDTSPTETLVLIEGQDTPAFLYALTNALSLLGINIVHMEVSTDAGKVKDKLWLTVNGEKITSPTKLKAMQWAVLIVKKFTHMLPRVPDPKAALEQFILFGKDIFESENFEQWFTTIEKPDVLENLSKVLGSGRYLWEELIRSQYESIVPIFENKTLLDQRRSKSEMAKSLSDVLEKHESFDKKVEALNEFKDYEMFRIDLRHLLGVAPYIGEFTVEFTDLAEVVVERAYQLARQQAAGKLGTPLIKEGLESQACVLGAGKFGGKELGYASDLEIMLIYEDAEQGGSEREFNNLTFYTEVVRLMKKIIRAKVKGVFELDLRLRPHGNDGPLAASLGAFQNYYSKKGDAWGFERQAIIKLRPVAGDEALGQRIVDLRDDYVFSEEPFDFQEALKLRVRQQNELVEGSFFNAKYSSGALIDIEYLVQMLQLAYSRKIGGESRSSNTLTAMRVMWRYGVINEKQFQEMRAAYIFLRGLINALRIVRGNALDLTVPGEETQQFVVLGRRLGFVGEDRMIRAQFKLVLNQYRENAARLYETFMEKLSLADWSSMTDSIEGCEPELRVSLDDLLKGEVTDRDRSTLTSLGFQDPDESMRNLKNLCPDHTAFEHFAKVFDLAWALWPSIALPDLTLKQLHWYTDKVTNKEIFWQDLSESSRNIERLFRILGCSQYLADILISNPEGYSWIMIDEELSVDRSREAILGMREVLSPQGLREFRRQETLRLALVEMEERDSQENIAAAFSELADFVVEQCLRLSGLQDNCCTIALGKLGGHELNFSSDLDLMFVADDNAPQQETSESIQKFMAMMKEGGPYEFLYRVDLRLRPHGDEGPLFMNHADYLDYYRKDADAWEYQALIKMRVIGGKRELGEQLIADLSGFIWNGLSKERVNRMREVKQKFEARTQEQNQGVDVKMGSGGIRDAEFAVQMTQLTHCETHPELKISHTLQALEALREKNLFTEEEYQSIRYTYLLLRRIENKIQLAENRQEFCLSRDPVKNDWIAKLLVSYKLSDGADLLNKTADAMESCRSVFVTKYYEQELAGS